MSKQAARGSGSIRKKTVKKNGKEYQYWEGRITVGRDPGTGKQVQRSITGKTQKEVQQAMNKALAELDAGSYHAPNKVTVTQWLTTWLDLYCARSVRPSTLKIYVGKIRNHILPAIGATKLQDLRGTHIQRMYNALSDAGLGGKTIRQTGTLLHTALQQAVKEGLITSNPCDAATPPREIRREMHPLTDAEIPRFLQAIKGSPYENAYALCLYTGIREGECLGISWRQVDFDRRTLLIDQQLQQRTGGYELTIPKSGRPRTIQLPEQAVMSLRSERRRQAEHRLRAGPAWANPDDLVFTTETGRHIAISTFYEYYKRIVTEIGRPDARIHDLRHTAATVALANGADIKTVQEMLGHTSASITLNIYAHSTEQMKADTAKRIEEYYEAAKGKP